MSWLPKLFKEKQTISIEELAQNLAQAFSNEVQQMSSDRSRNRWVWDALPQADPKVVASELAIVHMFLQSRGFLSHPRDRNAAEAVLDYFSDYACQDLVNMGLLPKDCDFESFLRKRFEAYYDAMRGSTDLSDQIMGITGAFFRLCCSPYNPVALGAATIYFSVRLVAEKQLFTTLERDYVIVS